MKVVVRAALQEFPDFQKFRQKQIHPNISTSSKRSGRSQSQFKMDLLTYYGLDNSTCMVAGRVDGTTVASHIWPYEARSTLHFFDIDDIWNPRNGLLLCADIEKQFGCSNVCFLYEPIKKHFLLQS